jgi:hypothetical protein
MAYLEAKPERFANYIFCFVSVGYGGFPQGRGLTRVGGVHRKWCIAVEQASA